MLRVLTITLVAGVAIAHAGPTFGHGGGLNAEGCHNDRVHGVYHCHRGPNAGMKAAPREEPAANPYRSNLSAGGSSRDYSVSFANCSEARAAGAAPVRRGDPGYSSKLDRDNDGIGCE
jgi:hypothetical protein